MNQGIPGRLKKLGRSWRRALVGPGAIQSGPARGLKFDAGPDTDHFIGGNYELPVQSVFEQWIRRDDVCYDIGANLGFLTLLASRLAGPSGSVHAFEPVPRNAATIQRNAQLNQLMNIVVYPLALSSVSGTAELLLAEHAGGAVLSSVGVPPPDPAGKVVVETAALDEFVSRRGLPAPNFVKLDVEGAELDVLKGMTCILRESQPKILIEVDDAVREVCERKMADCAAFLRDFGYQLEPVPHAYKDGSWFVRHSIALAKGLPDNDARK